MAIRKFGEYITVIGIALLMALTSRLDLRSEEIGTKVDVDRYPLYPQGADLAVSGLAYDPKEDIYWATSDRGAGDGKDAMFQPRIYQIKKVDQVFVVTKVIPLVNEDGTPARGFAEDPKRIDPEGVTLAPDGTLWMVDEYGPYIIRVSREGRILERTLPPSPFKERKHNQGFEGVTFSPDGKTLFAALQSSPQGATNTNRTYIAAMDIESKTFRTFAYDLTDPKSLDYPPGVKAAIGINALETIDDHTLLVIERDNQVGENARVKRIYLVDLNGADNNTPVRKTLYADLYALGYRMEKPEGLAIRDEKTVVVINDNDAVPGSPTEVWVLQTDLPLSSQLAARGK